MAKEKDQLRDPNGKPMSFKDGEPVTMDHYDPDLEGSDVPEEEVNRTLKLLGEEPSA